MKTDQENAKNDWGTIIAMLAVLVACMFMAFLAFKHFNEVQVMETAGTQAIAAAYDECVKPLDEKVRSMSEKPHYAELTERVMLQVAKELCLAIADTDSRMLGYSIHEKQDIITALAGGAGGAVLLFILSAVALSIPHPLDESDAAFGLGKASGRRKIFRETAQRVQRQARYAKRIAALARANPPRFRC